MKAAELFVKCLENEHPPFLFGLPGEENMDVLDALLDSSLRFVQTRHEQGAAFMADVQGRLTGRASVCLATLGPGATNLVTGVADANMDRAPLVAVTGQGGISRLHKESHQAMDLVALFRPMTKYNAQLVTPGIIPEVVRKAFKVAQTEKFGATHIDFPEDIASMPAEGEPLPVQQPKDAEPRTSQIESAAALINQARFPIILAGNGVIRDNASPALRAFVEKSGIPCAHTFMAKGVVPYTSELSLLAVGLQAKDVVNCGLERADVVLCIGYDLVEYHPQRWNEGRDKKVIHIDRSPAEVDAHYTVAVGIEAGLTETLSELGERITPRSDRAVHTLRRAILDELQELSEDASFPVKPQRIMHDARRAMGAEDILISDVGAHKLWVARMYPALEPNTCLISNGFASMGIALPGAIAAKLLYPDRRVLAVCGDGGFLMNCQEMETAVRVGAPIVCLVLSDGTFGLIKWKQQVQFGRPAFIDFGNPDLVMLARSFGWEGVRIAAADELKPALESAFASQRPTVIDCPVDYSENVKLTERLGKLVCPI
ncbi:MAG: acetolactate synthase large subunit [Phycisphaerae bacterium]|nr:acetolactate synthase large subunit [Phycisphaerae bacterium]